MVQHKKNILTLGRVFLLLLFVSCYSNITMFYHSHLVDGRIVSHSHWFSDFSNDEPVESHSHTSEEYILIHFVNNLTIEDDITPPEMGEVFRPVFVVNTQCLYSSVSPGIPSVLQSRAPPAC